MWLEFDSRTRRHMWVEFVVGSRPCSERFFSGYTGFPLSSKTNISKFQFDLESEGHKFISLGLLRATLVKQRLFIYLFILFNISVSLLISALSKIIINNGTNSLAKMLEMRKTLIRNLWLIENL